MTLQPSSFDALMRRPKAELAEEVGMLRNAIESISDGFVVYDADDRLIVCNDQYRKLFPEIAHMLAPGVPYTDVLGAALAGGTLPADIDLDQFKKDRLAEHYDPSGEASLQQLDDGRWIQIWETRSPAGEFVGVRADVTEFIAAQEASREGEARFLAMLQMSPVCVGIAVGGKFKFANKNFAEMFGQQDDAFSGIDAPAIFANPDDRLRLLGELAETGVITNREVAFRHPDGQEFWALFSATPIEYEGQAGVLGWIYDIADLKKAEDEATLARDLLSDAIENIPDGFVIYDADDRMVICNTPYKGMFPQGAVDILVPGVSYEEILDAIAAEYVLADEDWETRRPHMRFEHDNPTGEPVVRRIESGKWVQFKDRRTSSGGLVSVRSDVTEIKLAEEQAERANSLLTDAIESISDGFVVYDADDRLVIFNSSFRDMFPQKALEYLVPGIKYEMLMTHVISLY